MADLHGDAFGFWKKFTLTTSPQDISVALPNECVYFEIVAGNSVAGQIILNNGETDYSPIYIGSGYDSVKIFSSKVGLVPTIRSDVNGLTVNVRVFKSEKHIAMSR